MKPLESGGTDQCRGLLPSPFAHPSEMRVSRPRASERAICHEVDRDIAKRQGKLNGTPAFPRRDLGAEDLTNLEIGNDQASYYRDLLLPLRDRGAIRSGGNAGTQARSANPRQATCEDSAHLPAARQKPVQGRYFPIAGFRQLRNAARRTTIPQRNLPASAQNVAPP